MGGAVDSVRIQTLEKDLQEERRKAIGQVVAVQRAERKCVQLEDQLKRVEDQRSDAAQQARDAEKKSIVLAEDLRKSQQRQVEQNAKLEEERETAQMSAAVMSTIKYELSYELAKNRGALEELRIMLKLEKKTTGTGGGLTGSPLRWP